MNTYHRMIRLVPLFLLGGGACSATKSSMNAGEQRQMLQLLMPSSIEIVEPFTRVKSFDDDPRPDGIELLLQAVNSLGNPGLMIAGKVRVELYEYVPASAENKGRRFDQWDIELITDEHQRRYWNQVTQMYEFRLKVDPSGLAPAGRYVLAVTYNSPLGEHITDECSIEYRAPSVPLGAAGARSR